MIKSILNRKEFIWHIHLYPSWTVREVRARTQTGSWKQRLIQGLLKNVAYYLEPHGLLIYHSYTTWDHLLRKGTTHNVWGSFNINHLSRKYPQDLPRKQFVGGNPSINAPFCQMALTYIKLEEQQQTDEWRNQWKLKSTVIHEVLLLLHIFTWVWGHLLEHGRPMSCQSSINSSFPSPRNYQFANSLSVKVGTWRTIPSVTVSSCLWLTWYVLMTIYSIHLHPVAMST